MYLNLLTITQSSILLFIIALDKFSVKQILIIT